MKLRGATICFVAIFVFFATGWAVADSLTVNNQAAMGGSGTACSGGPCGLAVFHDNSSTAFVEDDSPNAETVYRGTFLFDPNNVNATATRNFRQLIMTTKGPNPRPGEGNCTTLKYIDPLRLWYFPVGGLGQISTVQIFAFGNLCGARGSNRIPIPNSGPVRICWELQIGAPGFVGLAVVDPANSCPSTGDPAWDTASVTNSGTNVDLIRLGTPTTNFFAAGESGTFYFDEFESYRTLTP